MAKNSEASFLESHIEKIILGICAVLLAIVAVCWIPSSPRRLSVISKSIAQVEVPPNQADAELLAGAQTIRRRNDEANTASLSEVQFAERISLAAAKPFSLPMDLPDTGIPGRSLQGDANKPAATVAAVTLNDIIALLPTPAKPAGWCGFEMTKPLPSQPLAEKIAYHGTALYPWGKLAEKLDPQLRGISLLPVILGIEVQERDVLPQGFGPEQTPKLVGYAGIGKLSDYTGGNGAKLGKELEELAKQQARALVADYPEVYDATNKKFVNWQLHLDIGGEPNLLAKTQPSDKTSYIPDLGRQLAAGKVILAFHDNSLQIDRSHSYRVRLVLANPLFALDAANLKDSKDAYVKDMKTDWSEWSDPIIVRNPTEFFLTGAGSPGSVQATVFTRKLGQVVMLKNLPVEAGRIIGRTVKMTLPGPSGVTESDVEFDTGCVAVDVEERRSIRTTGLTSRVVTTQALLLVNAKGELEWRVLSEDSASKRLKELRDTNPVSAEAK